jgi:UDPglucose 6-dehydrogenase
LFSDAVVYDKYKNLGTQEDVNQCDVAFICVPTPMSEDGSCDTSIVEEVIQWCTCKCLILRSTVRVGFTRKMRENTIKKLYFSLNIMGKR